MKVIYFGDGKWAHDAFDRIHEDPNFEILKVILRSDTSDEILRKKAEYAEIEVMCPPNVNDPEIIQHLENLSPDLGVSMSYNQIFKKNLIEVFPERIINCHAGKLPLYRGRNILNWALINGEDEIGVTCHYIDSGIDTGEIIVQKTFPVSMEDDYGTVLEKAINLCPKVLHEAMNNIKNKDVEVRPQQKAGTYFIARKNGDEFIDWHWNSLQIYNFVRAITEPGPLARSWVEINGKYRLIYINKVELIEDAIDYECIAGGVVGRSKEGYPIVKTGDNIIKLNQYNIDHNRKKNLAVGDRLGINFNLLHLKNYQE